MMLTTYSILCVEGVKKGKGEENEEEMEEKGNCVCLGGKRKENF